MSGHLGFSTAQRDPEPTPNPSQEGSGLRWFVPLLGGGRGGFTAGRFTGRLWTTLLLLAVCAGLLNAQESGDWRVTKRTGIRFRAVDVLIDSGAHSLAAYQLTFTIRSGDVKIVSIEGGEHPAFKEPPYYDSKAIQRERVVLAAFNTSKSLPEGKTRVATIHVQVNGAKEPQYAVKLETAADSDGRTISVETHLEERKTNE